MCIASWCIWERWEACCAERCLVYGREGGMLRREVPVVWGEREVCCAECCPSSRGWYPSAQSAVLPPVVGPRLRRVCLSSRGWYPSAQSVPVLPWVCTVCAECVPFSRGCVPSAQSVSCPPMVGRVACAEWRPSSHGGYEGAPNGAHATYPGMSGMCTTLRILPFPTALRLTRPFVYPIVVYSYPGERSNSAHSLPPSVTP